MSQKNNQKSLFVSHGLHLKRDPNDPLEQQLYALQNQGSTKHILSKILANYQEK